MTNKAAKQPRKKRDMSGESVPKVKFFGLTKLKPFLAPYKWMFLVMILGTIIVGVLNTVMPLFQEYAINNFIAHNTTEGLLPFILLYVLCLAVVMVIDYIASYNCCRLELYILRDMRRTVFNHLQTLSVSYFTVNSVGRIHARGMSDNSNISYRISRDV